MVRPLALGYVASSHLPLSEIAPKTVLSATTIPAPMATTTVEWPREKKNPNPSGRGAPEPHACVTRGDPSAFRDERSPKLSRDGAVFVPDGHAATHVTSRRSYMIRRP